MLFHVVATTKDAVGTTIIRIAFRKNTLLKFATQMAAERLIKEFDYHTDEDWQRTKTITIQITKE